MEHIGRVGHFSPYPVGNIFAEAAACFRLVADLVYFAEVPQASVLPVAHGHHHFFLIHAELLGLGEMQQAFPGVSESVGPLAGVAVLLVPDVFLCPEPALVAHRHDQLHHIGAALAADHSLFDIEHERACGLEHSQKLLGDRQKPLHIVIGRNAPVGVLALVGIRRRGEDQIYGVVWDSQQLQTAVSQNQLGACVHHCCRLGFKKPFLPISP